MTRDDFFWACYKGNTEKVKQYLDQGGDIEARTPANSTGLMLAARGNASDTVRFLIERGAKIHKFDEDGWTALYNAVWKDHFGAAKILLKNRANPRMRTIKKESPLEFAVKKRSWSMILLLTKYGKRLDDEERKYLQNQRIKVMFKKECE